LLNRLLLLATLGQMTESSLEIRASHQIIACAYVGTTYAGVGARLSLARCRAAALSMLSDQE